MLNRGLLRSLRSISAVVSSLGRASGLRAVFPSSLAASDDVSVPWRTFVFESSGSVFRRGGMGQGGGKGASDPETVEATRKRVQELITSKKVVIFAKGYCPYCHMARDAFKDIGYTDFLWVELQNESNSSVMQSVLQEMTGARTVPRVFIDGKCIGGGDDTVALKKSGQLAQMIAA